MKKPTDAFVHLGIEASYQSTLLSSHSIDLTDIYQDE